MAGRNMAGPSGKPQRAASAGSVPQQQPQQHQLPPPQQQQQQLTQRIVLAIRKFYGLSAEALQQLDPLWEVDEAQHAVTGAPEVRYSLAWQEQFALWYAGLLGRHFHTIRPPAVQARASGPAG